MNLVNVHGGMLGATNMLGAVTEPGWQACGLPTEKSAPPERTWATLRGKK